MGNNLFIYNYLLLFISPKLSKKYFSLIIKDMH
jgi:hypothetical protein